MREVPITLGYVALVDDDDYEAVSRFNWNAAVKQHTVYARGWVDGGRVTMHRLLAGARKGQTVDHVDGNGLNNQRANLRICSAAENARNVRRRVGASGHRGVSLDPKSGRWSAHVRVDGKLRHLGRFDDPLLAAQAASQARSMLHGAYANNSDKPALPPRPTASVGQGKRPSTRNTSGHRGVYWLKDRGCWTASIAVKGKNRRLGVFDDAESAAQAVEAARALSGGCSPTAGR